jgi:uncharacterized Zn-binding protein involved in type VI secretion
LTAYGNRIAVRGLLRERQLERRGQNPQAGGAVLPGRQTVTLVKIPLA